MEHRTSRDGGTALLKRDSDAQGEVNAGGGGDGAVEGDRVYAGGVDGKGAAPRSVGDGGAVGQPVAVKQQCRA